MSLICFYKQTNERITHPLFKTSQGKQIHSWTFQLKIPGLVNLSYQKIPKSQHEWLLKYRQNNMAIRPQISRRPWPCPFEVLPWCPQISINVKAFLTMCWPWCLSILFLMASVPLKFEKPNLRPDGNVSLYNPLAVSFSLIVLTTSCTLLLISWVMKIDNAV